MSAGEVTKILLKAKLNATNGKHSQFGRLRAIRFALRLLVGATSFSSKRLTRVLRKRIFDGELLRGIDSKMQNLRRIVASRS